MRWMGATAGLVLIVTGMIAAFTGQFDIDSRWLLAVGLALVGVVGLFTAVTNAIAGSTAADSLG